MDLDVSVVFLATIEIADEGANYEDVASEHRENSGQRPGLRIENDADYR